MEDETKLPKFIEELNNGNMKVTTKDGVFELMEAEFDKIKKMSKRCEGSETEGLISLMVITVDGVDKKINEEEIGKLKGSSVLKLNKGITLLMDVGTIDELF